jgi:hypothetical protein
MGSETLLPQPLHERPSDPALGSSRIDVRFPLPDFDPSLVP